MSKTLTSTEFNSIVDHLVPQVVRTELLVERKRLEDIMLRLPRYHQPEFSRGIASIDRILWADAADRIILNNAEENIEDRVWRRLP